MTPPYLTLTLVSILALLWFPFVGKLIRKLTMDRFFNRWSLNLDGAVVFASFLWISLPALGALLAIRAWWYAADIVVLLLISMRLFAFLE